MFLPDLWWYAMAYRRTQASQSQAKTKPESGYSRSGVHPPSESIIQAIERAQYAGDEATPSIAEETLRFANPLDANVARDSEQYQGCKVPEPAWIDPYMDCIRTSRTVQGNGLPTEDKARKRLKLWSYMMEYFPDAFLAEVEVAVAGNEQHNPGEPLHWARDKSTDQMNTAWRHQFDYGRGIKKDTDGQWHLAKAIWRLKAQLQLDIEEERRQNGDK